MNNLFDDLDVLEYFYNNSFITLNEYYEIKERIIEKYTGEKGKEKTNENNK